jgi:hypothetical protein
VSWNWRRSLLLLLALAGFAELVMRGIVPAHYPGKNDFSDPYVGALLWRQGQNPWDGALMTYTAKKLGVVGSPVIPVYPLTTYVVVAPFSFLTWKWANVLWVTLSVLAACVIPWLLLQIGELNLRTQDKAWLLIGLAMAYPPMHSAIHVANAGVIAVALCFASVLLAKRRQDLAAGIAIAISTGLKPQLGMWVLLFYLLRGRWRVAATAISGLAVLALAAVSRLATRLPEVMATYRADLQYSFRPGGGADFSGIDPMRYHMLNSQVVLWQIVRSRELANLLAFLLLAAALGALAYIVFRKGVSSEPLVLTSLVALSFIATYHRVTDATFFTLVLCWVLSDGSEELRRIKGVVLFCLLLLFLPVHSFIMRLEPHLGPGVMASWPWNLLVMPSFAWLLLIFDGALLMAVAASARPATGRP